MKSFTLCILLVSTFQFTEKSNPDLQNNYIYYSSEENSKGRDIYRILVNGEQKEKLTIFSGRGHHTHNNNPKLSPDGSQLVYQSDPDGHDRYTIWVSNTDGSNPKKITQKEGLYPNWSPDGEQIVFSGRRNGTWEILTVSKDGGKEVMITNNHSKTQKPGWGATCTWHPDGQAIIFSYIREKVLYSLNISSGKIDQLTPSGEFYTHPIFSPSGEYIAVNMKSGESYDMVLLTKEGAYIKTISENVISYSYPAWSMNEKELLFTGMVKGNQEIFRTNIETGEEKQLTKNSAFDAMPTW
ncbi:MAG: DUF5050 domain-containing protein [Cyclobacteriaceae bacterium]